MGIKQVIFDFLFYLSAGTFVSMGVLKQSLVGRNYFLYHGLGALGLAFLAYVGVGRLVLSPDTTYWLLGTLIFIGLFSVTVCVKPNIALVSYFTGTIAFLGAVLLEIATSAQPTSLHLGLTLNALLSALLLGFCMNAMLLGHWYLVQPKLSIDELRRMTIALLFLIFLRFLFGSYSLWDLLQGKNEAQIYKYLFSADPGIFVLMRWCWGLLGPMLIAYPIWGTVKIRSTQSATGLLYVAVLFIVTGEILSLYLAAFHGIAM